MPTLGIRARALTPRVVRSHNSSVQPKTIKRYANRKLYDTERSSYVTLDEIADMVKGGVDVRIIDNRTGEDLSSVTLAQIVFEEEKKQKSLLPLSALRSIIQSGEEFLQRRVAQPVQDIFGRPDGEAPPGDDAGGGALAAFLGRSQEAFEDLQRRVDERIHKVLDAMTQLPTLQSEVTALRDRIRELESRLEALESGDEDGEESPR